METNKQTKKASKAEWTLGNGSFMDDPIFQEIGTSKLQRQPIQKVSIRILYD